MRTGPTKTRKRSRARVERETAIDRREDENESVERVVEWQEHRYDPGHYTGGKIHPVLTGGRSHRYGYLLIAYAALMILVAALARRVGQFPWYAAIGFLPFMLLLLFAGLKLIKRNRNHRS